MSRLQVLDHSDRGVEIRGAGFWHNGRHVWITRAELPDLIDALLNIRRGIVMRYEGAP